VEVAGEHRRQGVDVPVDELDGAGPGQDVVANRLVTTGQVPQLGDPVGVGQEPYVHHVVRVQRDAVLEPERDHVDPQLLLGVVREPGPDLAREVVHGQVGG